MMFHDWKDFEIGQRNGQKDVCQGLSISLSLKLVCALLWKFPFNSPLGNWDAAWKASDCWNL